MASSQVPGSVMVDLETFPVETLRLSDFDPFQPSSAPVFLRIRILNDAQVRDLNLVVTVVAERSGLLGTASKRIGVVQPGESVVLTNREFDSYDITDAVQEIADFALENGILPADMYEFTAEVTDARMPGAPPVGDAFGMIETTNPGDQLELIGPGNELDIEPEPLANPNPIFQWTSDAGEFNFALYEVRPGQRSPEDISTSLPAYQQAGVATQTLTYPSFAEQLSPGKTYAWQVEAIIRTAQGPEVSVRRMAWFTIDLPDDDPDRRREEGAVDALVSRLEISPRERTVAPGDRLEFLTRAFSEEDVPLNGARPQWKVIPSASATIDDSGVFRAGDKPGAVAVIARVGEAEDFATVIISGERPIQSRPKDSLFVSVDVSSPVDGVPVREPRPVIRWLSASEDTAWVAAGHRVEMRALPSVEATPDEAPVLWSRLAQDQSQMLYPTDAPSLEPGEAYAVRVAALDTAAVPTGTSDFVRFTFDRDPKISHELFNAWDEARRTNADTADVRLLIRLLDVDVRDRVTAELVSLGARIEVLDGPWAQVSVPYQALNQLAALDLVGLVKLPSPHVLFNGDADASAPAQFAVRPAAQQDSIDIAVFEFGFDMATVSRILDGRSYRTRSFRADGSIEGTGGVDATHGAATVAALQSYLPSNARVHLINFDTEPEFHQALTHATSVIGARVMTCSVSWVQAYDHYDGTSFFSQRVEEALGTERALVVAAGNYARGHWEGFFTDADGDGYHDFVDGQNALRLGLSDRRVYNILLSWNDWTEMVTDLDIEIVNLDGEVLRDRFGRPLASRNRQGPDLYGEPVERISGLRPYLPGNQTYLLRISNANRRNPRAHFELYVNPPPVAGTPASNSASSLAAGLPTTDSDMIIPVGADGYTRSSRGPTNDGRTRPDFGTSGKVRVSGSSYEGTSFAAPRIAAALTLVLSKYPSWSVQDGLEFLREFCATGAEGKNNTVGWGSIDLEALTRALNS